MSDPYSANVSLLLHMEGSHGSTALIDSSGLPKTISPTGFSISTAVSKWGNGSGYCSGSGIAPIPDALPASSNFTVEFWAYTTVSKVAACVLGKYTGNNDRYYFAMANGQATMWLAGNATPYKQFTTGLLLNTWYHVAFVRSGNTLSVYIDGQFADSVAITQNFTTDNYQLFRYNNSSESFVGYLQDLRITKSVARYTENFTPPTARLPDPDPVTGLIIPSGYRHDLYDGGAYRIAGNVDELGVAGSYRVRLFDRQSGRCVRETWSAADGSYAFNYIDYRLNGYFAIAFDHGDTPLNAAIADLLTPEPMP